ncbi:hypothetical protein [Methylobacterium sp. yr596]|uniref:hypothetical protein n=1 Tax=Methylobacterium sp. yr596 TaxID=1761800 RepID=UPI0008E0052E|nr:hypothetical protein [Methylobacterium sp. yr596]SFF77104.1 hypothetical protein SAMN04487844_14732 [Methylobacterium sp. yr596]
MSNLQLKNGSSLSSSPEAASRQLLDLVARFTNRLEENVDHRGHMLLSARAAPGDAEREVMEARRQDLRDSLAPGDPRVMRPVIAALLGAFPTYGADRASAEALLNLTARALDDVPVWAVQQAAGNFIKGRVKVLWSHDRAPTPPQIRGEAKHCMLSVEEEIVKLSKVLDATIVDTEASEDERAAALAHWEKIKREILSTNGTDAPKNLQAAGLRETNDREKLKEHARLAAAGETLPVAADGLTISTALRESNRRYAAERGIRQPQEA